MRNWGEHEEAVKESEKKSNLSLSWFPCIILIFVIFILIEKHKEAANPHGRTGSE